MPLHHHQCERVHSSRWSIKVLLVFKCSCKTVCSLQLQQRCQKWSGASDKMCYAIVFISKFLYAGVHFCPLTSYRSSCALCWFWAFCWCSNHHKTEFSSFPAIIQAYFSFEWVCFFLASTCLCVERMETTCNLIARPTVIHFRIVSIDLQIKQHWFEQKCTSKISEIVFNNFVELPQMIWPFCCCSVTVFLYSMVSLFAVRLSLNIVLLAIK